MMHPAGTFEAEILDHGITESRNGNPQVAVKFQTDSGVITGWFALTNKAAEYTVEKVKNMGFNGESLDQLDDGQCLVGNRCQIVVNHEKWDGDTKARVSFVNPEGYSGVEIEHSQQAAAAARQFNGLLRKANAGRPAVQPVGPVDDDIPF